MLSVLGGGHFPRPPEVIALRNTGRAGKGKVEQYALPIYIFICLGARVAPQRCPILRAGLCILLYDHQKEIRILKIWMREDRKLYLSSGSLETAILIVVRPQF